ISLVPNGILRDVGIWRSLPRPAGPGDAPWYYAKRSCQTIDGGRPRPRLFARDRCLLAQGSAEDQVEMGNDVARRAGRSKVTVVGAGMVGGTVAQLVAQRDYADVVLVDIVEGLPQGKAL